MDISLSKLSSESAKSDGSNLNPDAIVFQPNISNTSKSLNPKTKNNNNNNNNKNNNNKKKNKKANENNIKTEEDSTKDSEVKDIKGIIGQKEKSIHKSVSSKENSKKKFPKKKNETEPEHNNTDVIVGTEIENKSHEMDVAIEKPKNPSKPNRKPKINKLKPSSTSSSAAAVVDSSNTALTSTDPSQKGHSSNNNTIFIQSTAAEDNTCIICAKSSVYSAFGSCHHPICSVCALRLRVKQKDKSCVICKAYMETMFVYSTKALSYEKAQAVFRSIDSSCNNNFDVQPGLSIDSPSSLIFYQCGKHLKEIEEIRSYRCPTCRENFPNEKKLFTHLESKHKSYICDICFFNQPFFIQEHTLYSKSELNAHKRHSDTHAHCGFCNLYLYDKTQLYTHLRDTHLTCHHCPARYQFRYYRNMQCLLNHMDQSHFLCKMCNNIDASFQSHTNYAYHTQEVHGKQINRIDLSSFQRQPVKSSNSSTYDYIDLQQDSNDDFDSYRTDSRHNDNSTLLPSSSLSSSSSSYRIPSNMRIAGRITGSGHFKKDESDQALDEYVQSLQKQQQQQHNAKSMKKRSDLSSDFPSLDALSLDTNHHAANSYTTQGQGSLSVVKTPDTIQIMISNLPLHFDIDSIANNLFVPHLLQYKEIKLSKDKVTKSFKGVAYVTIVDKESADFTIHTLHGYEIDGNIIKVEYSTTCKFSNGTSLENPLVELARKKREEKAAQTKLERENKLQLDLQRKLRNDRLASALGIQYRENNETNFQMSKALNVSLYAAELIEWGKNNVTELLKIEKKLFGLIDDIKATSLNMKPMKNKQRNILHSLSKYYSMNSYEYDAEPNRYVSFVKLSDSKTPCSFLSQRIKYKLYFPHTLGTLKAPLGFPYSICYIRRSLDPLDDPTRHPIPAMSGYGPHQERRIATASSSKVEILSNLSSIQDLVSRIQMIHNSSSTNSHSPISVKDWHIDAQYANAVIISFKTEQEAISILSISTSDKCISLRYDTEAAGSSSNSSNSSSSSSSSAMNSTTESNLFSPLVHPQCPQYPPPPPGFSSEYNSNEHPITMPSHQDAWFESEEIATKPKSFADAVQIAERKALQLNNSTPAFPSAPTEEVNRHGHGHQHALLIHNSNDSGPSFNSSSSTFQRLYPKNTP